MIHIPHIEPIYYVREIHPRFDFVFSDNIEKWMHSAKGSKNEKERAKKRYKNRKNAK